ncbi:ABC transporter permease [Nitrospira sp. Nam80]
MRAVWVIAKREVRSYLTSPVAYVVSGIFLALIGFLFYGVAKNASERSMQLLQHQGLLPAFNVIQLVFRPTLENMGLVSVFVVPLLTMRLLAEERRQRTYDLLFSAPIPVLAIVVGKFLGAVVIYTGLLLLTLVLPVLLNQYAVFPWTALAAGYVGLWLLGLVFIAVGLFASSLTEYQIVAGFTGMGILLALWAVGLISPDAEMTALAAIQRKMALYPHFDVFMQGLMSTGSMVFFLTFTMFWLAMAYRVVEANRWR